MIWGIIIIGIFFVYDIVPTYYYKFKYALNRKKSGKNLYLTFDDGPSEYTLKILDLLKSYNIKCTFFVVIKNVTKNKDVIKRMLKDGHLVGIHSYNHQNAWTKGYFWTKKDFNNSINVLKGIGVHAKYYRAPWGNINLFSLYFVRKFCLKIMFWNVMAEDWRGNTTSSIIKNKILKRVRGGDIICLHDGRGKNKAPLRTYEALKEVIPILLDRGYSFRRIDSYDEE